MHSNGFILKTYSLTIGQRKWNSNNKPSKLQVTDSRVAGLYTNKKKKRRKQNIKSFFSFFHTHCRSTENVLTTPCRCIQLHSMRMYAIGVYVFCVFSLILMVSCFGVFSLSKCLSLSECFFFLSLVPSDE